MAEINPVNSAHFDANQVPTVMGVVGTLGTADTKGTALPLPVGVDPSTGAAYVYNLGPAGSVSLGDITGGTIDKITALNVGTIGGKAATGAAAVENPVFMGGTDSGGTIYGFRTDTAGVLQINGTVSTGGAGTQDVNVIAGTVTNVGTIANIGKVHNAGTVAGGTLGVVSNLTNGSIVVTAGTVGQVTPGTAATHLGKGGSVTTYAAGDVGVMLLGVRNENFTTQAGTEGQYVPIQTDRYGRLYGLVDVNAGTINTGSIIVTAGTIGAATVNTVGTLSNLLAGTIQNSGTTTGVGVVSNLTQGSINVTAGTVYGGAASGAAASGNPVLMGGTDAGGTVYAPLLTTAGALGSVAGIGVVTTVTNLSNGTIQNSGTVTGVGVVSALTSGSIAITAGTIGAATVNTIGTLSNLLAGTIQSSGTTTGVGVVSNLTAGSINVVAGTVNSGTINAGTINSATINTGTIVNQPYPATQVQAAFAVGTVAAGTLVAAAGAGTGIYINSISLTCMSGTLDMCLSYALGSTTNQVVNRGLYSPGGGIAQSFPHPSFYGTANSALTYQILGGAGTASWQVNYTTKGTP